MVKVYSAALVVGLVGLLVVIMGGALAGNLGHDEKDPGARLGRSGRMTVAALVGFGMAGLSAEFAPLGFEWGVSLVLALLGAVAAALWVRFGPGGDSGT